MKPTFVAQPSNSPFLSGDALRCVRHPCERRWAPQQQSIGQQLTLTSSPMSSGSSSQAISPSAPRSPTSSNDWVDGLEWEDEEEELDALAFEDAVLNRAEVGATSIAIPGAAQRPRHRTPLPLAGLARLDRHCWENEPALLAKWSRGAGVGAFANSVSDAMFVPCSPPRRR